MTPFMSDAVDGGDAAIQTGSALILDRLFRTEHSWLTGYVRRRLGSHEDIYDLVQEAFARLASARPATLEGSPEAYLRRILQNLLINRAKRKETRLAGSHLPIDEFVTPSVEPNQAWRIEADDMLSRYRSALGELPERTREVFMLHRVDELSYREIATKIGISTKAIEYHMTKALAHLDPALYRE